MRASRSSGSLQGAMRNHGSYCDFVSPNFNPRLWPRAQARPRLRGSAIPLQMHSMKQPRICLKSGLVFSLTSRQVFRSCREVCSKQRAAGRSHLPGHWQKHPQVKGSSQVVDKPWCSKSF